MISGGVFDSVHTCGPELMVAKAVSAANSAGLFVRASVERVMKCGAGVCGSCCAGSELACTDGPVFDGALLAADPGFGVAHSSKSGVPVLAPRRAVDASGIFYALARRLLSAEPAARAPTTGSPA